MILLIETKQQTEGILVLDSEEARRMALDLLRAAEESEDHGVYEIEIISSGSPDFDSKIQVRPKRGRRNHDNLQQLGEGF